MMSVHWIALRYSHRPYQKHQLWPDHMHPSIGDWLFLLVPIPVCYYIFWLLL
jgi:hypothetical protein